MKRFVTVLVLAGTLLHTDAAPYPWRGLMLDEARHFFGRAAVCRFLDRMAADGFNVFHWHLTDHQGWRIELKRHPEVAVNASVRDIAEWRRLRTEGWLDPDGEKYGPYCYTQDEIREVVAYAASRGITIVPEIDIPGHCRALLKAMPELQCEGVAEKLDEVEKGYRRAVVCAGSDAVLRFYEDVIDEVCALFPSKIIHLGGDEVKKDFWKACPKCQARMRAEGLKDETALQGWFMHHFADYLAAKGRRMAAWDEILGMNPPKSSVIFCWRGGGAAKRAVEAGYEVVMCPEEYCYFDFQQGLADDPCRYHPRGDRVFAPLTVEKVRSFDPVAGIPAALRPLVLGAQGNSWTELTLDEKTLVRKVWPRAKALAEVLRNRAETGPSVSWSVMHPVAVEPDYMRRLVAKAAEYGGVDSFEVCGECNQPHGGLNGLLAYEPYPKTAAAVDRRAVEEYRRRLGETLAIAHAAGKKVYFWHREGFMPKTMAEDRPGLLDEDGEYDLLGKDYLGYVRWKVQEAFRLLPDLDGVVLTLTEADFSVIHNSRPERYPPARVVETIARVFLEEHAKRGKRMIFRSFGSIASDYRDLLAGANACAEDFDFEIETKITPYDFSPFLGANPYLKRTSRATIGAECDGLGEYLGAGYLPAAQVEAIARYVGYGQDAGVDRYTIRIDRVGNSIFDSAQEVNLHAYMSLIADPSTTPASVLDAWAAKRWPGCPEEMKRLSRLGFEAVTKTQFIDRHVMFHQNPVAPSFRYLKACGIFSVFRDGADLANTREQWGILSDRPVPGRRAILAEKDEAVRLADEGLALLASLKERLPPDEYARQRRAWRILPEAARAIRAFTRCAVAYFDDMERRDAEATGLRGAITSAEAELLPRMKNPVVDVASFDLKSCRARGDDLDRVYYQPFLWLCREFLNEYRAEFAAREKLLADPDVVDFVIPGGIYDDNRVLRVMHASYADVAPGVPVRYAGNATFPNGTVSVVLRDAPGARVAVDAAGAYTLSEVREKGSRRVVIGKKGAGYPAIRSIALRRMK